MNLQVMESTIFFHDRNTAINVVGFKIFDIIALNGYIEKRFQKR